MVCVLFLPILSVPSPFIPTPLWEFFYLLSCWWAVGGVG
jgi:hypothetical protein